MNKKEFIKRLIDMGGCGAKPGTWSRGWDDAISEVLGIAEELDEPQKPVIPQFVADYIEKYKDEGLSLGGWFIFNSNDHEIDDWLCLNNTAEEKRRREYLFIDAIRYGYEVEKEKKYYVLNHKGATMLVKNMSGAIECSNWYALKSIRAQYLEKYQLTETEIKSVDERYWAFAKPVEEVEE